MIYLGGYVSGSGQGIGVATLRDGALALESTAECPPHPSYLAVAPGGRRLYAVHELDPELISAFAIADDGSLRLLGTQPSSGAEPCHLSVHPSGRYVLSAHWGSGSIAVHPVERGGASVRPPISPRTRSPRPTWWSPTRWAAGSSRCTSVRARSRPGNWTSRLDGCDSGKRSRSIEAPALVIWPSNRWAKRSMSSTSWTRRSAPAGTTPQTDGSNRVGPCARSRRA